MNEVNVLGSTEPDELDESSDVSRRVVFETDDILMVQPRVAGGVTTGWHHNGDRHVFASVDTGRSVLEYGRGCETSPELGAGDFGYVPPRTIRRVVDPTDEAWVVVICFVGTGPPAGPVDGPGSEIG